jgi:hypothetical protein
MTLLDFSERTDEVGEKKARQARINPKAQSRHVRDALMRFMGS